MKVEMQSEAEDAPPSYDDVAETSGRRTDDWSGDSKLPQRINIRDEVGASRSQHVAALVGRLLPQVRKRAKSGISRMTFLMMPSDQVETTKSGQLVGFADDDQPILVQLEGRYDVTEFWTQKEALQELHDQMLGEIVGDQPHLAEQPLPERPAPPHVVKTSFWGKKQSRVQQEAAVTKPAKAPVAVNVQIEQINFRTENEYGLYETLRSRAVMMAVDVR